MALKIVVVTSYVVATCCLSVQLPFVYIPSQDPGASYDVNGHDSDPQPRYDFSNENRF